MTPKIEGLIVKLSEQIAKTKGGGKLVDVARIEADKLRSQLNQNRTHLRNAFVGNLIAGIDVHGIRMEFGADLDWARDFVESADVMALACIEKDLELAIEASKPKGKS